MTVNNKHDNTRTQFIYKSGLLSNKALSLHIYPDSVGNTGFGSFSYQ